MGTQNRYNFLPNVLVGMNFQNFRNYGTQLQSVLDFSPAWCERPYSLQPNIKYDVSNYPRMQSSVFLETNNMLKRETMDRFQLKSMMSLDGLFSPISFYPTPYTTTFSITKYTTENCPFCYGTKIYNYVVYPDNIVTNLRTTNATSLSNSRQEKTIPCPFCETQSVKNDKVYKSSSPAEVTPPYIIASGDDLKIISKLPATGLSGNPVINYTTLNPIVLSIGEFSNFQNKQIKDSTGHCIDLVSNGSAIPYGFDDLRPGNSISIGKSYIDYDLNLKEYADAARAAGVNIPPVPDQIQSNTRFFGLRGPVMLHAWGYDLEGYPVPNSSGEPLIRNGAITRDAQNNIIGKNQKQKSDGTWTKPYKENTFYNGWAQQPGTWPVGPIDFRWDEGAGLWTVGSNYKDLHIVIEEDMVGTNPVRGQIIDSAFDNSPLPDDLRRLVFVKDSIGIYSAPRGAAVYCKYNSNNGFYEPIGHRPFTTSGTITSSNTVDIYKIYTKPNNPNIRLSEDPKLEVYNTTFKNPLKFDVSINDVALFNFIDGAWVVYAYNAGAC
jgi:hypothetical protein